MSTIVTLDPIVGRTLVIGDLHGCYDEALTLLERLQITPDDRVIFVGDLIDRGPKPRECVELAMQHTCIRGNHEEKHLQQRHRADEKLSPDHRLTRDALADEHYAWLATLPMALRLPQYNAIVVHAGMFPDVALDEQQAHHLLHLQYIEPPNPKSFWPSKAPPGFSFWTQHWRGPERVIFGHTVLDRPLLLPFAAGIDTGACFGGGLTALILPSWEFVTVPSRDWCDGKKREARYAVDGDVRTYS